MSGKRYALQVRLGEEDLVLLEERALACGLTKSAYVREAIRTAAGGADDILEENARLRRALRSSARVIQSAEAMIAATAEVEEALKGHRTQGGPCSKLGTTEEVPPAGWTRGLLRPENNVEEARREPGRGN